MALLAAQFEHLQTDVKEMKADLRAVKDSVVALRIETKDGFAVVDKAFAALKIARVWDRVWWLMISAGLLGVMARAFKWL